MTTPDIEWKNERLHIEIVTHLDREDIVRLRIADLPEGAAEVELAPFFIGGTTLRPYKIEC